MRRARCKFERLITFLFSKLLVLNINNGSTFVHHLTDFSCDINCLMFFSKRLSFRFAKYLEYSREEQTNPVHKKYTMPSLSLRRSGGQTLILSKQVKYLVITPWSPKYHGRGTWKRG